MKKGEIGKLILHIKFEPINTHFNVGNGAIKINWARGLLQLVKAVQLLTNIRITFLELDKQGIRAGQYISNTQSYIVLRNYLNVGLSAVKVSWAAGGL